MSDKESGRLMAFLRSFGRSVVHVLAGYRWYVLAVAALAVFGLSCYGYGRMWHDEQKPSNWTDAVYWTVKTFLLSASPDTKLPVALDIARFLAPVVAGYAGVAALAALFRDRVQQMRIPLMRGHVVVCGLGYVGSAFLRHLRETGARVVGIESDATNPGIELCRRLGVPVIVGDAQLRRTLVAAGVERAARLLAVTPDDAVNAEIIAIARRLAVSRGRGARGPLGCLARIGDPEVCALLRVQETERTDSASSLDFFNTDEISARLMLDEFPIDDRCAQPHIVVADLGVLGAWVVYHAARDWYERRRDHTVPLVVTVVDDRAEERIDALLERYPALEPVCRFISLPESARNLYKIEAYHAAAAAPRPSRAFVTAYCDEQGLDTALKLRHELDADVPLVVALSRTYGMARLLDDVRSGLNFDVFPTLERTCTVELIQGGSFETIAQAIHRRWCAEQRDKGQPAPSWSQLDESRKESSRAQARDIAVKLRAIGCEITPLRDWAAADLTFTDEEVGKLAVMEHDRWVRERIKAGWTSGDKDVEQKKTPYLVPHAELPPDIAEYDRIFVREIPPLLASVGMQVVRAPHLSRRIPEAAAPIGRKRACYAQRPASRK